jgi:DNA-binding CsgD family transcriptional regulator
MCATAVDLKVKAARPSSADQLRWASEAVSALGGVGLLDAVHRLICSSVVVDGLAVLQFFKDKRPRVLFCNPLVPTATWDTYTAGPYLFDPIYQHFVGGGTAGVYRLIDIAQPEYLHSEFFKQFIASHDNCDERDLLVPTAQGWAFGVMLTRSRHAQPFSESDVEMIQGLQPLVAALLRRHATLSSDMLEPETARDLVQRKIDTAMRRFGASILTPREHAVLRYLLGGYSSSLIGERLGIAEGTVKIHRRSIHAKLDLNSQAEVLALFLQCIPLAEPDSHIDPLIAFHGRPPKDARMSSDQAT